MRAGIAGVAALWFTTGAASAQEGGIEVFAAETIFRKGTRTSVSHIYKEKGTLYDGNDDVSDPLDRTRREHRVVAAIDHGFREDLTVSALLPYVWNELESDAGDLDGHGLGDISLLVKQRVYKTDWTRSTFNVSLIGGVEMPTGKTSESEGGTRLPPPLQPGSGSWDPFFALASNVSLDRYRFDFLAFYKVNTEGAQDYEDGDFSTVKLSGAYRFLFEDYPGPTASAKVALAWKHEGRDEQDSSKVGNTGSDQLLISPGLSWHPRPEIDISFSVELPLLQDFNGTQLGLDYRTFLAVGIRF